MTATLRTPAHRERAWAEIHLPSLRHNVQALRRALPPGCDIMAVVKANAYGHGAAETSVQLNRAGVRSFAVATIDEGIRLRQQGIRGDMLILGYTPATRVPELIRHRLSQTVADAEHARELNHAGKPIPVHVKVDTGMHRLGEDYRHVAEIVSIFNCRHLAVEGIYSHMCVSDNAEPGDAAFSRLQIRRFQGLLDKLKAHRVRLPAIHMHSSYGVLNDPEPQGRHARIGIALYGVLSAFDDRTRRHLDLRPVLALKARVTLVRTVEAGESVGYGRAFVARTAARLAVIAIGYADGVPRSLSGGRGHVLIRGCRAPIVGRICMDQLMADVTALPDIRRGDVATLIGRDGAEEITAEQAAADAGTITNELLSRLSDRLERVFLKE